MPLARRLRVSRFDPQATALLVARQHIPHPVAAAATLDSRVKALPRGRAKWAVAAPGSSPPGRHRCLPPSWIHLLDVLRHSLFVIRHYEPAASRPQGKAETARGTGLPVNGVFLSEYRRECNHLIQPGYSNPSLSFPLCPCKLAQTVKRALWIWRGLLLAVLGVGLEPAVWAAPKLLLEDLSVRSWTKEDGLPDDSVTAVLQTRDGYLWVGTMAGLARFDGVRFVVFSPMPARSNELVRVTALCEDSAGGSGSGRRTGDCFAMPTACSGVLQGTPDYATRRSPRLRKTRRGRCGWERRLV